MYRLGPLVMAGALFKWRKAAAQPPEDGKAKEEALRKKLVDAFREREDAVRKKESELAEREEELKRKDAELAQRMEEVAARGGTRGDLAEGESAVAGGGMAAAPARTAAEQERLILDLEEGLARARVRLEELVVEEKEKAGLLKRIEDYRAKGYVVASLEAAMVGELADIRKAFEQYATDIQALSALAERCDQMDPFFASEVGALKARCKDPAALAEVENELRDLASRVEAKRAMLAERIAKWKAVGYVTSRLDALEGAHLTELEAAVIKYDECMGVLNMFKEKLDNLDKSLEKEAAELRPLLKDPDSIPELEKAVLALEQRAGSQKQDLMKLLQGWKDGGYRTESLDGVLNADLTTMQAAFLRFDEDVRRLKALAERVSKMDGAFASQTEVLSAHLHNPALIEELEDEVRVLEEQQDQQSAELRKRIDGLKVQGYPVDGVEAAFGTGGLESARLALEQLESDVQKLAALAPRVKAVEAEGRYTSEVSELARLLRTPGAHARVENILQELEERSRLMRWSEEKARIESEAAQKERLALQEKERQEAERLEKEKAERVRAEKEKAERERAEKEKAERERAEKEKAERERTEKEKAERESVEKENAREERPVQAGATAAAQASPAPAAQPQEASEEEVRVQMQAAQGLISELVAKAQDSSAANNFLTLARTFSRTKNYPKAMFYAKKASETATRSLKKQ